MNGSSDIMRRVVGLTQLRNLLFEAGDDLSSCLLAGLVPGRLRARRLASGRRPLLRHLQMSF